MHLRVLRIACDVACKGDEFPEMKTIDAPWDTRNLGRKTVELEFDATWNEGDRTLIDAATRSYQYSVAKVPVANHEAVEVLQSRGFHFVECSLSLKNDLHMSQERGLLQAKEGIGHHIAVDADERNGIIDQVRAGLFHTDRISLDERFGIEVAANRYGNWILDELEGGAELYSVTLFENSIGFFTYKELPGKISYPFLIGLFPKARGKHLGSSLIIESLLTSLEHGCAVSETIVSSNNPAVIRCQESVGSYVCDLRYVFVRHS